MDSWEFDEKVPFIPSKTSDKHKDMYADAKREIERENLLYKFESQVKSDDNQRVGKNSDGK